MLCSASSSCTAPKSFPEILVDTSISKPGKEANVSKKFDWKVSCIPNKPPVIDTNVFAKAKAMTKAIIVDINLKKQFIKPFFAQISTITKMKIPTMISAIMGIPLDAQSALINPIFFSLLSNAIYFIG